MGYYSLFSYELEEVVVDIEKCREVEEYFMTPYDSNKMFEAQPCGFFGVELEVEDGQLCSIMLDDYYGKFYDDSLFADKLSKCIKSGSVKLLFKGEYNETWGYMVTNNRVIECSLVLVPINIVSDVSNEVKRYLAQEIKEVQCG